MREGNVEQGVVHLANALAVSNRNQQLQLLQMFQISLPENVFAVLCQQLAALQEVLMQICRIKNYCLKVNLRIY